MCGYFLNATSEYPVLMSGYLVRPDQTPGETLLMRTLPLTTISAKEPFYGNGSIHFKQYRNTIADVLIVSAIDGTANSVYQHLPPVAQECILTWCVKTIRSSYDWGKYNEIVLDTYMNTTQGEFPWVAVPFETATDNGTDLKYLSDINIDVEARDGRALDGYGTSSGIATSIISGFTDFFPSYSTTVNNSKPIMRYKTWNTGPAWTRELDFNPWSAPNNVPHHMGRMATAMTNVIRSARSKDMLAGTAFSKENYVSVRWEWLTLPIGLLLLSFVFLAATIFKSAIEKDQVGIMKNSAILTLLYGVSDDIRGKLTRSSSTGTPRAKAKELKVKLNPNMGWRISGNLFSPLVTRPPPKQPPPGWI
jgi:hypothetical protein